jgi:hypothetical protein
MISSVRPTSSVNDNAHHRFDRLAPDANMGRRSNSKPIPGGQNPA